MDRRKTPSTGCSAERTRPSIIGGAFANFLLCVLYTLIAFDKPYWQVAIGCCFLTSASVLISKRHWKHWADELQRSLEATYPTSKQIKRVLIVGQRKVRLGTLTILLLLVFGESWGDGVATIVLDQYWRSLTTPLLTAFIGAFAHYDAAFWICLRNTAGRSNISEFS